MKFAGSHSLNLNSSLHLGVNWIAPHTLPIIRELYTQGQIQFCEIMVDNVIHLHPTKIKQALNGIPVCLHIVASRFLELSFVDLKRLSQHLKPWIKALNPLYVSDHLVEYTNSNDFSLAMINELDYENEYQHIKNRVIEWQELLDTSLLFENHASITQRGEFQAEFFTTLLQDTHTNLLFDFSNAYIAEYNGIAPLKKWENIITKTTYFHIGGYRIDPRTKIALDTHDHSISENALALMQQYLKNLFQANLVIECNANVTLQKWQQEICRIKENKSHYHVESIKALPATIEQQNYFASQNLYRNIFQRVPKLKLLLGDEAENIFSEFLNALHCIEGECCIPRENVLNNSWLLHLYFLNWLMQTQWQEKIDTQVVRECMQATVIRWSLRGLEHVTALGLMLYSRYSPNVSVGFWKSHEAGHPGKMVFIRIPAGSRPTTDSYAISHEFGIWPKAQWQAINPAVTIADFA